MNYERACAGGLIGGWLLKELFVSVMDDNQRFIIPML